ncbi:MAG TPA: ThuA domain-containing protein [Dehalococcoidia bacterium]|nr:ThuA domain-containing protein [Dehalococcoidia bacterium]
MVSNAQVGRVHVVAGGYPVGALGGHDMDYARMRILERLQERELLTTVAGDFTDIEKWLPNSQFLITYTAGPFLDDEQNTFVRRWIDSGGRWLGLHGSTGGKAARQGEGKRRRMMKTSHHDTLGGFFVSHPPIRRFDVEVTDNSHPLVQGLPATFDVVDEPYMVELQHEDTRVLLTSSWGPDPSKGTFGFDYDKDTTLMEDGKTRAIAYTRDIGKGGVTYYALGHCHSPASNSQPNLDPSATEQGEDPLRLRGPWETDAYQTMLDNAIDWGTAPPQD